MALAVMLLPICCGPELTPTPTLLPEPTLTPTPTLLPQPTPTATPLSETVAPDEIVIEHHNLFPKGLEYDEGGKRFLLGSLTQGTIYQVADDGTSGPFIEDDDLQMSIDIEIDRLNDRLLVANTSHSEDQAMLGAYDLETGRRIFMVNLSDLYPGAAHVANDVAVDADGIAYVTDTYVPVIYRVDMEGQVSLLVVDVLLAWINGIVSHPDGYLLLGASPNQLLKIPLDEPEVVKVGLADDIEFDITDGIVLCPDGTLMMVAFPGSVIYHLGSDDNWTSASRIAVSTRHGPGWGTTLAVRGTYVYVIYSHLDRWMNNLGDQDTFEIVRVVFEVD